MNRRTPKTEKLLSSSPSRKPALRFGEFVQLWPEGWNARDAAFLLTVGSFLLAVELFLLTVDNFSFFTYNWSFFAYKFKVQKNSLNIKFLGGIFLGHPGPSRRDIPDKNFMQAAFFCCFRQGVGGMSRDLGRDVPDLEKLYARKLWADFSYPKVGASLLTVGKCV